MAQFYTRPRDRHLTSALQRRRFMIVPSGVRSKRLLGGRAGAYAGRMTIKGQVRGGRLVDAADVLKALRSR